MAPGADGGSVNIPSVFISLENCAPLFSTVEAGDSVSITFLSTAPPPIDGDFDNGIVAHEIGHGVSNRLVGGPNNTSCLFTDEQMGEGWSDFFSLASTPKTLTDTPDGSEGRGMGGLDRAAHGLPSDEEFIAAYCERRGLNGIDNFGYYLGFTFFRMAAIIQGVLKRALDGNASNPERALKVGAFVPVFAQHGLDALKRG